jgi:FMN phosphatase YigB (HAD superfamily)
MNMIKLLDLLLERKKLRVFDFDDTLVKTDSYIYVTKANGKSFKLTPGEYAVYNQSPDDKFDYRDFSKVINPVEIKTVTHRLRRIAKASRGKGIYILTARSAYAPIKKYLKDIGIPNVYVVALASNNPEDKAKWIESKIDKEGYDDIYFIDDSLKNVRAVNAVLKDKEGVRYHLHHLKH